MSESTFKHSIEWRDVPGFPDYEVSEFGDLRQGLKYYEPERTRGNGRKRFALLKDGETFRLKASQIVALAFIGPKPFDGAEVCHNNGFEHNNHYTNLRWDTHGSNMADRDLHKLRPITNPKISDHEFLKALASKIIGDATRPRTHLKHHRRRLRAP